MPSASDALLAAYLADRDEPCPRCRYNLRALTVSTCPECRAPLSLVMRPESARPGAFIAGLVGLLPFAVIAMVAVLAQLKRLPRRSTSSRTFGIDLVVPLAVGLIFVILTILWCRSWIVLADPRNHARWWLAALCLAPLVVLGVAGVLT